MEKNMIFGLCGDELLIALQLPKKKEMDSGFINVMQVREEGCYMKDYIIDGSGQLVRTSIQHVLDRDYTIKK